MTTPADATAFTLLARGAGILGTRQLGFCIAEGAWCAGSETLASAKVMARDGIERVPLGTQLVALVDRVQLGFLQKRCRRCAIMPTVEHAHASSLNRSEAWRRAMLLPLANSDGTFAYTFIAATSTRMQLVGGLIAAARQRSELGARALPVVALAREVHHLADVLPLVDPLLTCDDAAVYFTPALVTVGWVDFGTGAAGGRDHESES